MIFLLLARAGIAFEAASNSGYQTASASYSWAHTCTGSDRYLIVGVSMLSVADSSVSGITYNGVAMTLLGAQSSGAGAVRVELWGLAAPASGSNTIAVTLSAALDSAGNAASFAGVHQSSSTEGFASATATNVGAADATVAVTSVADNAVIVDIVASDDTAISVGAGQTQRGNVTGTLGSGALSTEGPKTPAGAVTMSWTDIAALKTWSIAGIALRPVAAASGETIAVTAAAPTWAGQAASLHETLRLTAAAPTWEGQAATVNAKTFIAADTAEAAWAGLVATLTEHTRINADAAAPTWAGVLAKVNEILRTTAAADLWEGRAADVTAAEMIFVTAAEEFWEGVAASIHELGGTQALRVLLRPVLRQVLAVWTDIRDAASTGRKPRTRRRRRRKQV